MKTVLTVIAALFCVPAVAIATDSTSASDATANPSTASSSQTGTKAKDEWKEFHQSQQEKREAFQAQQKEEHKTFMQGEKSKTPQQLAADLKVQMEKQYTARATFHKEQFDRRYAFISQLLSEKSGAAQVKQDVLKFMTERQELRAKHYADQHAENLANLARLAAKQDLTMEELHSEIKKQRETQQAENQKFQEEMKAEAQEMRTKMRDTIKAERKTEKVAAKTAGTTN